MSARAWAHPGRWLAWSFVGLIILIGVSIAASLLFFSLRGAGTPFVFFPFGFGWFFIFWIFIFFWGMRWWGGWGWHGRRSWYPRDDAHAILRERYARGEIGKEQFEQMMRDLEQHA